jgi:hypothetical protein
LAYLKMLKLLDKIEISDGAVNRRIALYQGDLTAIPPEHRADILIVSANPDHYTPTATTLLGALDERGLSVGDLAARKLHDLRTTCAFWISPPLEGAWASLNIGQIACFEPRILGSPPVLVGDLFRGLFPFLDDRRNQTVAMPVLASGRQRWPPDVMLRSILDAASNWLARGLAISELKIVECREDRAAVLAAAMADFKTKSAAPSQPNASERASFDVFLSFSNADAEAADAARTALLARSDAKAVFDYRLGIDKGKSWQEELDRAISSSRSIVAILSPDYFASPECREELMQARLRNKRADQTLLFPIYWRDWGKELDLWLQLVNYADCRECDSQSLTTTMHKLALG